MIQQLPALFLPFARFYCFERQRKYRLFNCVAGELVLVRENISHAVGKLFFVSKQEYNSRKILLSPRMQKYIGLFLQIPSILK